MEPDRSLIYYSEDLSAEAPTETAVPFTPKGEVEFSGGYGRIGTIGVYPKATCDVCHEIKPCIISDGSEGEYGGGAICQDCANKMFKDAA